MFLGEYPYRVDVKGRIPLPPKFKAELKPGLVLTRGSEGCIAVYPQSEWAKIVEEMAVLPPSSSNERRRTRFFFSGAFNADLDAQGRVVLPLPLREYARIEHDAMVVGCNNYVEIWNQETWKTESALASEENRQVGETAEER